MDKYEFVKDYLAKKINEANKPDKKRAKLQLKIDKLKDELSDLRAALNEKCDHTSLLVEDKSDCCGDGYGGTDWYYYTTVKCEYCRISSKISEGNPFSFSDDELRLNGKFDLERDYEVNETVLWKKHQAERKAREEAEELEKYKQLKKKFG